MSAPHSASDPFAKRSALGMVVYGINVLVVLGAVTGLALVALPVLRGVSEAPPAPPLPTTMEEVDWHDAQSSQYCLACHQNVGRAAAGLDVEHGHPQNVKLSDEQITAVRRLGTVTGPDNTLICMSCHQLGQQAVTRFMLADKLDDSELCQACHPGHYARGTPHDLRMSAPKEKNRRGETTAEGGPCSACHLSHRYAREFVRSDLDPDGRCLTCHQAQHVAAARARNVMQHPETRCLECHDPHDTQHGEFLAQPIGALCVRCHENYDGGLAHGMHPLGHMDRPIPAKLVAAGAHNFGDANEINCVTCHSTHEAKHGRLLHFDPQSNELCLSCHEEQLKERAFADMLPRHGQRPVLTSSQQDVVQRWGHKMGADGELLCVSCHSMHNGSPKAPLLPTELAIGVGCITCHPEQQTVLGTRHDLRGTLAAGSTVAASGAGASLGLCQGCHRAHGPAQPPLPADDDRTGLCRACHAAQDRARTTIVQSFAHPETQCGDCHNPHAAGPGEFLRDEETALCARCHEDQLRVQGGPHDVSRNPTAWPADAAAGGQLCLTCHVAHGPSKGKLLRMSDGADASVDAGCLACHPSEDWHSTSGLGAIHPPLPGGFDPPSTVFVATNGRGGHRMACRTCHDPHSGALPRHLAAVGADEPSEALCERCHVDKELVRLTSHSAEKLSAAGYETDSCKPCHAMHASSNDTYGTLLSPRFLMSYCQTVAGEDLGPGCVPCLACHRSDAPGPTHIAQTHPEIETHNMIQPDEAGYMPLFDAQGRIDPEGQITCRTCHLSHGRLDLLERFADQASIPPAERSQIRAQVRSFTAPNLCTICHGDSGRLRYLYFHDPARRQMERQQPTGRTTLSPRE